MAQGIIYQVDSAGKLTMMQPGKPAGEDEIQRLIADHPQLVTGVDEALLLIKREAQIADRDGGSGRWALDHMFVSRTGKPVLVEVKQASNTQLRREVIGQILEYGANASFYWDKRSLAQEFIRRCGDDEDVAGSELEAFLGEAEGEGKAAADSFWESVEANLQAGRFKLVIVADEIPRELARIVEFLNEQMQADVQAVELRWYTSDGGIKALVPRMIGQTERATERKSGSGPKEPHPFWEQLKQRHPDVVEFNLWTGKGQDLFRLRNGNPKIIIGAKFTEGNLRVYVYFDYSLAKTAYRIAKSRAGDIEARYGHQLVWDDMEGYQAARILEARPNCDMADEQRWAEMQDWLAARAKDLKAAVAPVMPEIEMELARAPHPT